MKTPMTKLMLAAVAATLLCLGAKADSKDWMVVDLRTGELSYYGYDLATATNTFNTAEYKTEKMVFRRVPEGCYYVRDGAAVATMERPYYIGMFPVTVAQYNLMLDPAASVSETAEDMRAVVNVSYADLRGSENAATVFGGGLGDGPISRLNALATAKLGSFDLPTESMWEIAARAIGQNDGTNKTWPWFFGASDASLSQYAFYNGSSEADGYGLTTGSRVPGCKLPNAWGLYDIYGNVWERCLDTCPGVQSSESMSLSQVPKSGYPYIRQLGGSFANGTDRCRTSDGGGWQGITEAAERSGFRLAMISDDVPMYTVTWKDYDGTVLASEKIAQSLAGRMTPLYNGARPKRSGHLFTGWSPAVATLNGDAVYTATYQPVDGLVAYYKFDGDTTDSSYNGYDWVGTAAIWTTDRGGESNRAALFSGSGTLTPNDLFGEAVISNSLTIAVWVKPSGTLPANLYSGQYSGTQATDNPLATSGTEVLYPAHGGYSSYAGVGLFVGTNGVAVGRLRADYAPITCLWYGDIGENWVHVAITISNNGGPVLYVNGVHVATGVQMGAGSINYIGKSFYYPYTATHIGPFRGALDDMRFYDRALGAEEVAQFMGTRTITWLNEDSSEIDATEVADGFTPTHAEPTKEATPPYRYLFSGWMPALEPVVSNTTYTATFQKIADLALVTEDWTAKDGDAIVLTNATDYAVTIPAGASVTINGVTVKGANGGGAANPAPAFAADGKAATTEFVQGEGGKWTLTTFAELSNDAVGADVAAEQIKVYAADTVEGLESASPMTEGVEVKEKKSAVKTTIEVTPPPAATAQFFKVKFGE